MYLMMFYAAADRLRDRDNATGIGDNSAEIGDNNTEIGYNSAEIGDDAGGIVNIAANVIPSQTPSRMETGVTLFLEDKFQRGTHAACCLCHPIWKTGISINLRGIAIFAEYI